MKINALVLQLFLGVVNCRCSTELNYDPLFGVRSDKDIINSLIDEPIRLSAIRYCTSSAKLTGL